MAYIGSKANGNWTDMTTWSVIHTASFLNTAAYGSYIPTTVGYSASWAGDNTEVDGVYVCIGGRTGTTGTFTIILRNTTDNVDTASLTLNVSDVPASQYGTYTQNMWTFLKFASPVTMTTGKNFAIGAIATNASQLYLVRNSSTASTWAHAVRTTTQPASHGAGDYHFITGEWTAAGTRTDRTVTMNENSTTAYSSLVVGNGGTLNYAINANTQLRLAGNLSVQSTGRFSMGTVANPVPSDYTAIFEFDCTANNQFAYYIYGNGKLELQGTQIRTTDRALLAVNAGVGATSLTVDRTTGWKNGDIIRIAATDGTYNHHDTATLNADASGTSLSLTAGTTYAHLGTAPIQAEIINCAKNVIFRNNNQTYRYACYSYNYSQIDWDWAMLGNMSSGTYNSHSASVNGSVIINNCGFNLAGIEGDNGADDNFIINDNVFYNPGAQAAYFSNTGTPTNAEIRRNWVLYAGAAAINTLTGKIPVTDNRIAGSYTSGIIMDSSGGAAGAITEFTGNICHDNYNHGFDLNNLYAQQNIGTIVAFRNRYSGISFNWVQDITIDSITAFENATTLSTAYGNIMTNGDTVGIDIGTLTLYGTITFATPHGIHLIASGHFIATVGTANIYDHGAADLYWESTMRTCQLIIKKTTSFNTVVNAGSGRILNTRDSFIKCSGYSNTPTAFKTWKQFGTFETDGSYYHDASPSQRVKPFAANKKIESGSHLIKVTSGNAQAITVYVRKSSVAAGGADYGGNQPRLIVKANPNLGISSDYVMDTMTAGLNNWEQLSGSTPSPTADGVLELVVDCDGTAGFINVDDWALA